MVLPSFEDFQKIRIFPKFEGSGSKTASSTPISILNFSRRWQSYFLRYALEILITYGFFIDKKWCFIHFSVSSTGKLKFEKNRFFFSGVAPNRYIIVHNHDFLYHLGVILKKKKKLFSNFSYLVGDTERWIKHHFLSIKNPQVIKISRAYLKI